MTNTDPDDIRTDIDDTRRALSTDVDALAEKVTPSKIMHRQTGRMKSALSSARDRVFGAVEGAQDTVTDTMSDAPRKVAEKAKGNPVAAGLIAFGIGWMASSLIPASEREKELAGTLKEKVQPLAEEASDVAGRMADDLREPAHEAMDAVKGSATEAASTVKDEGTRSAENLRGS